MVIAMGPGGGCNDKTPRQADNNDLIAIGLNIGVRKGVIARLSSVFGC